MKTQNNRFRKIQKWGNSLVIVLTKSDVLDLNIKKNDRADISDMIILSEKLYKLKYGNKK